MKHTNSEFDEHASLHKLAHFLPAQAALKDFVHHNTLHAFQNHKFFKAIQEASQMFGYRTSLSIEEYRTLYAQGRIQPEVLTRIVSECHSPDKVAYWMEILLYKPFLTPIQKRIGALRHGWKDYYKISIDKVVQPILFRLLSNYLDQGISINSFPLSGNGFLAAVRDLESHSVVGFMRTERARKFLLDEQTGVAQLLDLIVGDASLYEQYLFDQQFTHPGWSGIVSVIEMQPETLLDQRSISLRELIIVELIFEIDALDQKFGDTWKPLGIHLPEKPEPLFQVTESSEVFETIALWQKAYEWSYYDEVLAGIAKPNNLPTRNANNFQALFCIDDRSYSLRRNIESIDPECATYGTPGFFGVEFYFRPENGKFLTKACPAPITPKYMIHERNRRDSNKNDLHYSKRSHGLLQGWLITQTLGFWAAFKLFLNLFRPTMSPAAAYSFRHMDKHADLSIEYNEAESKLEKLQVGFKLDEMAERLKRVLGSTGLTGNYAPLVYVVGHGASSVNNTHYAGYDCGACCGRPGAVNARTFAYMANKPEVRALLRESGIEIPDSTRFVAAMHDTTRDEIEFYDDQNFDKALHVLHEKNVLTMHQALQLNARERSRRFATIDSSLSPEKVHELVKRRSVSLFEPRPEMNHAFASLCIIGRNSLTSHLYLDARPFMNSYDYRNDPDGIYLEGILNAAAPVCGGINLEYYFSRVDIQQLGAGTKLPHNVIGLFAVANGVEGDLRPGLPSQMIELSDPWRLLFIIEQRPEVVLNTIKRNKSTLEWFENEWVHLTVKDPDSGNILVLKDLKFELYTPLRKEPPTISEAAKNTKDVTGFIVSQTENIPVMQFTSPL